MDTCVVEIITRTEGTTERFLRESAHCREDRTGVCVLYTVEKDDVELYADESSLTMVRKGDTPLSMRFVPGETTAMRISGGEGEVPLHTEKYSFIRGKRGFQVRLSYDLLFSAERQHFYVIIRSEEK